MDATLQAEKRETNGKNEARRLRASGRIPAVVYGAEKNTATPISVDPKVLSRILHSQSGANSLIALSGLDGGDTRAGRKCMADRVHGSADTRVRSYLAVMYRNVEIRPDQDTFALEIQVGHFYNGHKLSVVKNISLSK